MDPKSNSFETIVETCCHHVSLRYRDFRTELSDELKETLKEHGEARAKECIIDDCCSGELNCYVSDDDSNNGEEIRGWWEIVRD